GDQVFPVGELGVEDLDRHHPVHLRLGGLVDAPHAARADLLQDLELALEQVSADVRVLRGHARLKIAPFAPSSSMRDESTMPESSLNGLESPLLGRAGFRHAFFTREGGVSRPPWDTLNFAASTGDDPARVQENLARAARALGVSPE